MISEALNYDTVLRLHSIKTNLFRFRQHLHKEGADENAPSLRGRFTVISLTMTYFHTGTRTIIGADAFHCPVRDGKEWYHVAMVVRHKLFVWLTEVNRTNL